MTTYVYETIPQKPGEAPRYSEIRQSMQEAALTKHPETGEPIRRVILGGYGLLSSGAKRAGGAESGGCCGGASGCCG
jgi:predicted nucleic acid-binding Zn ribbon protein